MVTCPVCSEMQLAYYKGPEQTSCYYCGARWVQTGDEQERIIRRAPRSAPRSSEFRAARAAT